MSLLHMLAAQQQAELEATPTGPTSIADVDLILDENRRLKAKLSAMTKKLDDLSTTNKSLSDENRRLKDSLSKSSSSNRRSARAAKTQSKSPKSIPISISAAVNPEDVLMVGLTYAGFDPSRLQRNNHGRKVRWFKSFYGVSPTTVAPYLQDMKDMYPRISFKDCLMTMNWLFLYDTYPVLSPRWKQCEEYIGDKVIEYGLMMAELGIKKIIFKLDDTRKLKLGRSLDCVTFMIQEMRLDPSSKWYDYKTHSCGLVSLVCARKESFSHLQISNTFSLLQKYESCLATREPKICSMRGPFIPSMHDITVFRGGEKEVRIEDRDQSALYFQIGGDERFIGDSGYSGEPSKVVTTKDEQSSEFKEFLARAKNRQETFHTRLKSFNVLGTRFRHGVDPDDRMRLHKMAVLAVTGIIQTDYLNGHPPFDIC